MNLSFALFTSTALQPVHVWHSLSLKNIERDQEATMYGSIVPVTISPRQPPGNVYTFRPGVGELLQTVLSPGAGGGAIETMYSSSLRSTSILGPRGEVLPEKCPEFVADWLELNNLSRKKKIANPQGYARRG